MSKYKKAYTAEEAALVAMKLPSHLSLKSLEEELTHYDDIQRDLDFGNIHPMDLSGPIEEPWCTWAEIHEAKEIKSAFLDELRLIYADRAYEEEVSEYASIGKTPRPYDYNDNTLKIYLESWLPNNPNLEDTKICKQSLANWFMALNELEKAERFIQGISNPASSDKADSLPNIELLKEKSNFTLHEAAQISSEAKASKLRTSDTYSIFKSQLELICECVKKKNFENFYIYPQEIWCLNKDEFGNSYSKPYSGDSSIKLTSSIDVNLTHIDRHELLRWCDYQELDIGLKISQKTHIESLEKLNLQILELIKENENLVDAAIFNSSNKANAGQEKNDNLGVKKETTYLKIISALARALSDTNPDKLQKSGNPLTGYSKASGDSGIVGHLIEKNYTSQSSSCLCEYLSKALKTDEE